MVVDNCGGSAAVWGQQLKCGTKVMDNLASIHQFEMPREDPLLESRRPLELEVARDSEMVIYTEVVSSNITHSCFIRASNDKVRYLTKEVININFLCTWVRPFHKVKVGCTSTSSNAHSCRSHLTLSSSWTYAGTDCFNKTMQPPPKMDIPIPCMLQQALKKHFDPSVVTILNFEPVVRSDITVRFRKSNLKWTGKWQVHWPMALWTTFYNDVYSLTVKSRNRLAPGVFW